MSRLLLSLVLLTALPAPSAEACGSWGFKLGKASVVFLVANVRQNKRLIFTVWGTAPRLRAVDTHGRQVISSRGYEAFLSFRGDVLRRGKRPLGRLVGSTLTIAKKRFELLLTRAKHGGVDGAPAWVVDVKQGGRTIGRSTRAYSFQRACGVSSRGVERQKQEVRQRIALYLAWRSVGTSSSRAR